jgi:hypothetical protein
MNPFAFLKEFVFRFAAKSPVFFRVIQVLSAILSGAGYITSRLETWFGVPVSDGLIDFSNEVAKYALTVFATSMLTVDSKPTAIAEDGSILKQTDEKKLPFTAKIEEQKALREIGKTHPESVDMKTEEKKDE